MERDPSVDPTDAGLEQLLFETLDAPSPPHGFAARTLKAVKRAPLPPGRMPLRSPLTSLLGWAAILAGVAVSGLMLAAAQPMAAASATRLVSKSVGTGVWLMQLAGASLGLVDVFATAGKAMSRAAATPQGTVALLIVAVAGGLSASALHHVFISQGEGPRWQES